MGDKREGVSPEDYRFGVDVQSLSAPSLGCGLLFVGKSVLLVLMLIKRAGIMRVWVRIIRTTDMRSLKLGVSHVNPNAGGDSHAAQRAIAAHIGALRAHAQMPARHEGHNATGI